VTLGNLTASGGTLAIKASGGTSDVVNVTGTATFTGGSVSMLLGPTAPTSLTYNVVTSGNAITGTPGAGSGALSRATYTVINTGNSIQVQFSAKPAANLTWTSGTTNWDNVQTDANWTTADSGIADTTHFYDGDYVTFSNNSGGTVNFNTNVAPTIATVGGTGNYTFASAGSSGLTGAGALVKTGSGSLTLNNTNTHTGGTTLNQGTLNVNTAGALGTGPLTINGGTLDNTSGPALTLTTNNAQVWAGSFAFTGTSDLNVGTGAVTLNGNPVLTVSNGTLTVGGIISDGTGNGYTKAGPGTLVLAGRSLFTGVFNITDGVVKAGIGQLGGSVFGSTAGPTNISGTGTVDIANQALNTVEQFNIQGDGFSGQGAIVNNGVSLSPGLGTTSAEISRVTLTGDASVGGIVRWDLRGNDPQIDLAGHTLNKVGNNFVDLVSTQVRSTGGPGVLRVTSGTLGIEANSSLNSAVSTGSVVVESGGNLNFWSTSGIVNWPITFKGSNDFANCDTGASTVASNITLAGSGITIYPRAGGAGPTPPLPGDRISDQNTTTNFGTFTLSGSIGESGGSFGLTKEQNGTLILAGSNTFTGGLMINGGTVQSHAGRDDVHL
jgi:autotransporter-associated beta strand protein